MNETIWVIAICARANDDWSIEQDKKVGHGVTLAIGGAFEKRIETRKTKLYIYEIKSLQATTGQRGLDRNEEGKKLNKSDHFCIIISRLIVIISR